MNKKQKEELAAKLRALIEAVISEMAVNPDFAARIAGTLHPKDANIGGAAQDEGTKPKSAASKKKKNRGVVDPVFDPLELHLEAALRKGGEAEVRAFLSRLDRAQLEEVVKAQRLPGARSLLKTIAQAENLQTAVDTIVASAAEKLRERYLAAG